MHQVKKNGIVMFVIFLVVVALTVQHSRVPLAIIRKDRPSITSLISTTFITTFLRLNRKLSPGRCNVHKERLFTDSPLK